MSTKKVIRRKSEASTGLISSMPVPSGNSIGSVSLSTINTADIADDRGPADAGAINQRGTQIVHSPEEGNALVKRLKQLEAEGASLASSLAKVCDENASLSGQLAATEAKLSQLAAAPLKETSVLRSLFEPDKTGWFGGSKSAAREQLEKLSEALQREFIDYKSSHTSSNEEVQALVSGLHDATVEAAELSNIVKEQRRAMADGPYAITVRIIPVVDDDDGGGGGGVTLSELKEELNRQRNRVADISAELAHSSDDLRAKNNEVLRLQGELKELRQASTSTTSHAPDSNAFRKEVEMQNTKDENTRLQRELQQLRDALATEERLHSIKVKESESLSNELQEVKQSHAAEVKELQKSVEAASSAAAAADCPRCKATRAELAQAQEDIQSAKAQLTTTTAKYQEENSTLQGKLAACQSKMANQAGVLAQSVSGDAATRLTLQRDSLNNEVALYKDRIAHLETLVANTAKAAPPADAHGLDTTQVLAALQRNTERISQLEFDKDQLKLQVQEAQAYASTRDQEVQRLERASAEDKQRVNFLLKKTASTAADLRSANLARDALSEELDKCQVELKQQKRLAESIPALQRQIDSLVNERRQLADRLASTEELEERLVKAKETIAYMELAQSRTINISQYAALQADKEKLENTMGPLKRQLEDAMKDIEQLRKVTDAQQVVSGNQKNSVQVLGDQVAALTASEAKLREKVSTLTAENERLTQLNASLEAQMTDMQDGIKEMAMKMDQERTSAKTSAAASAQRELDDLKAQLGKANATIAEVQATRGQFVAEGLYKSAVAERDRLAEDVKKKSFDMEKLKSEILIYRQTIADLEAENDEHVKGIESLQDRYQAERSSLSERLGGEQKRVAELNSTIDALRRDVQDLKDAGAKDAARIKELDDCVARQKRAFENKSSNEQQLMEKLADLQRQYDELHASAAAAPQAVVVAEKADGASPASATTATATEVATTSPRAPVEAPPRSPPPPMALPSSASTTAGDAAASARQYQLQCENDRLRGELKRAQLQYKTDADGYERMITTLQTQIKSRMSANDRAAYDAEITKSANLKKSNDMLLQENEALKKQLATGVGRSGTITPNMYSAAPSSPSAAGASQLQMQLIEAQRQLEAQRETFNVAMTKSATDAEAATKQITDLQRQLKEVQLRTEHSRVASQQDAEDAADGDDGDGPYSSTNADGPLGPPEPKKKKVKRVKKKKTLAEQVVGADESAREDVLLAAHTGSSADEAKVVALTAQLKDATVKLTSTQQELEVLQRENTTLRETNKQLTSDLANAHEDLNSVQNAMDEERDELQKQIHFLENQRQTSASAAITTGPSSVNSSFAARSNQKADMELRCLRDENDKLRDINKRLEGDLARATEQHAVSDSESSVAGGSAEVNRLRRTVRQKDAEINALSKQLLPAKQKLAEYMAVTDRLGLHYPFPPELEGATLLRFKALKLQPPNRAVSAPQTARGAGPGAQPATPLPRPPDHLTPRVYRRSAKEGEGNFSLR